MSAEEKWERVIIIKDPNEPEAVPVTPIEDMEQYKIGIRGGGNMMIGESIRASCLIVFLMRSQ